MRTAKAAKTKAEIKATITGKIKKVIAASIVAVTLATSISLSPVANTAITAEAKCPTTGHTKKVTMQPLTTSLFLTDKEYPSASDINKVYKQLDAIIKECGINTNTTEYDAVDRLDTWITKNIKAGYNGSGNDNVEMVLKTKKAVCVGYYRLFDALCNRIGIKSTGVHSGTHAWNIVQIDGVWYHIDTCWDTAYPKEYFLLSESEIQKKTEHHKIRWFDEKEITQTYTIKYNLNGGKNKKANIKKYTAYKDIFTEKVKLETNMEDFTFKKPTRKGYIFKGWYYNNKKITKLSQIKGKENVTLTAKWEKVKKPTLKNVKIKVSNKHIIDDFYMDEIKLTWKKATNTSIKYEIKYEYQKEGRSKEKRTLKTTKNTISFSIPKGAKYKVTVRAYMQDSVGKKTYSKAKTFTNK